MKRSFIEPKHNAEEEVRLFQKLVFVIGDEGKKTLSYDLANVYELNRMYGLEGFEGCADKWRRTRSKRVQAQVNAGSTAPSVMGVAVVPSDEMPFFVMEGKKIDVMNQRIEFLFPKIGTNASIDCNDRHSDSHFFVYSVKAPVGTQINVFLDVRILLDLRGTFPRGHCFKVPFGHRTEKVSELLLQEALCRRPGREVFSTCFGGHTGVNYFSYQFLGDSSCEHGVGCVCSFRMTAIDELCQMSFVVWPFTSDDPFLEVAQRMQKDLLVVQNPLRVELKIEKHHIYEELMRQVLSRIGPERLDWIQFERHGKIAMNKLILKGKNRMKGIDIDVTLGTVFFAVEQIRQRVNYLLYETDCA